MIRIDGSQGEGGGQILRTSLALSLLTNQPFEMFNIRARRQQPGLRPQHLASVKAAASICKVEVEGASPGSSRLVFQPGKIHAGRYEFNIATAGSTCLVLQTTYLPLSQALSSSSITITGGTHVPKSPSFEYLDRHWLHYLKLLGFDLQLELITAGFYPQGGGKIQARIRPSLQPASLVLLERGKIQQISGISAVANLDRCIAERQRKQVLHRLGDHYHLNDIRIQEVPSRYKGTFLLLLAEFESSQACFFSLGELGKPAEQVADEAVEALVEFLASDSAIDHHLADQMLLPLSFAIGRSQLRTSKITNHLLTNAAVINTFIPNCVQVTGELGEAGTITIQQF
jgi:RNA 3'-terminal phosphate cyclase (ATP)